MSKLKQYRFAELSLWQSAVDEVVAKKAAVAQAQDINAVGVVTRPDSSHSMVAAAVQDLNAVESGNDAPPPPSPPPHATEDVGTVVRYCSSLARNYAWAKLRGDQAAIDQYGKPLLEKFGVCDPGWADTAIKYAEFLASRQAVPYRTYKDIGDYVIPNGLPDKGTIAIVGDWGTGQAEAKQVLAQLACKQPDVVIHLGDIYYSATDFEVDNYFYNIWSSILDLTKVRTYTLAGNHDMFSGGAPYYRLIDKLGQPASYFCLRNANWQFVNIDTGLNDREPGGTKPTFLQDTEVAWIKDKIQNAGGRRTILLSHHQLFTAYEDIAGQALNDKLLGQLSSILPSVDMWLWGHEHNLVFYDRYQGVLARCIGHGGFPVGVAEIGKAKFGDVPVRQVPVPLGTTPPFYNHGYAIIDLDGASGRISYYQDTDEDNPQFQEDIQPVSPPGH